MNKSKVLCGLLSLSGDGDRVRRKKAAVEEKKPVKLGKASLKYFRLCFMRMKVGCYINTAYKKYFIVHRKSLVCAGNKL